jgi:hypothetical protein
LYENVWIPSFFLRPVSESISSEHSTMAEKVFRQQDEVDMMPVVVKQSSSYLVGDASLQMVRGKFILWWGAAGNSMWLHVL